MGHPGMPICGVGYSCGAAQLRNYVNMSGHRSKLAACVAVDAAEDWEIALDSIDRRQPLMSSVLANAMDKTLEACGIAADPDLLLTSMSQFSRSRMAPAHGFGNGSSYLRHVQPADPAGCRVPMLELSTFNDLLVDVPDIASLMQLHTASPHVINCSTHWGTHIVRWEGWRPQCWIATVAFEFIEAALPAANHAEVASPSL